MGVDLLVLIEDVKGLDLAHGGQWCVRDMRPIRPVRYRRCFMVSDAVKLSEHTEVQV